MALENSLMLQALNEDVLFEIFKFLSPRDRNNAKLVCQRWFRVSQYKKLMDLDAFYFSNLYSLSSVVKILKNCKRKIFNLKFDQRKFYSKFDSLWEKYGARIESLQFHKCTFYPGMMQQIFIHCVNLKEFYAGDCEVFDFSNLREYYRKRTIFPTKNNILRENLTSLEIHSPHILLKKSDLLFIANTFPRLKRLKFNLTPDFTDRCVTPNFHTLLRLLDNKLSRVKILHIEFPNDFMGPVDYSNLRKYNLSRLKDVRTTLNPNVGNLESIFRYKFWKSFRITWMYHPVFDINVLIPLINENPLLEELTFSWRLVPLTESDFFKVFTALVKSNLKYLHVDLEDVDWSLNSSENFASEMSSSLENLKNYTVHTLHINVTKSVELSSLFVKYFPNTRDLFVKPWDPQVVFSHQKNLKCIEIAKSAFHSTTKNISSKITVENLEFMDTQVFELNLLFKYRFPNLKYLCINESDFYLSRKYKNNEVMLRALDLPNCKIEDKRNDTTVFVDKFICNLLPRISKECLSLEGIEFNCRGASFRMEAFALLFQSCQQFRKLRHISLICDFPLGVGKADLKRLLVEYFEHNATVRVIWLKFENYRLYYFFNVITRKLQFFDQYSNLSPFSSGNYCNFKTLWCNQR